ncbi:hypothetical protein [Ornithobacterium rhinotracheale]|uniref:hypothetical protein n=1 Tax=Ornithobacterium rhinotracheale TaxID=28251 RepID=UPI00403615BD
MIQKEITEEEWDLINAIRNYRKAYPNGAKMLKNEIQDLVDELMDLDYQEQEKKKE